MLNIKTNKTETQKSIKENLKALATVLNQMKQPELDAKYKDILKIQKALVMQNIDLIIQASFRGNQTEKLTKFDTTTDLMLTLKPYFKRKIGEKRKQEVENLIGEYFCPESVNGLKIKCYISFYYEKIQFLFTENGFTHGCDNDLIGIYFSDYSYQVEYPLDFENLTTQVSCDGKYISVVHIETEANKIYNQQQKAADKLKKLIGELNQVIESSHIGVPYEVRTLENYISVSHYMTRRLKTIDY